MEFSSLEFLAFLLITLVLYYFNKPKYRWIILLVASLIFIYSFSLKFLLFTSGFAILNYLFGIAISVSNKIKIRSLWYQIGIWTNIGLLVFYKYTNFLLDNLFSFLCKDLINIETPYLNLIVPLGISFYTFQSIGYLIDVKRGIRSAEINPGKFALFIIYFPKFISGPVERTNTLLPQLNKDHIWNESLFNDGLLQMLWGFFKTIVISDRLAIIVNGVNSNLYESSGSLLKLNFFIQFLYLYFNFSGYTDIVLGISKLFGVNLSINFNRPLFANSVSNYWRRWHISLTTWCNEYIFKRVIFKRKEWGEWAPFYGVFITFLIIGIWHGASWNFVILGLLQGIAINYEYFTKKTRLELGRKIPIWVNLSLSRLLTLIFICISHVFFYTKNFHDSIYYFSNMFNSSNRGFLNRSFDFTHKDLILVFLGFLIVFFSEYRDETGRVSIKEKILKSKPLYWIVVICAIIILLTFRVNMGSGFIYTQF